MWLCFARRVNLVGECAQRFVCMFFLAIPAKSFLGDMVHTCRTFILLPIQMRLGLALLFEGLGKWVGCKCTVWFIFCAFARFLLVFCCVLSLGLSLSLHGMFAKNLRQMLLLILNSIITHVVCGLALSEGLIWSGNGQDSCVCLPLDCYEGFLGDKVCSLFICDLASL